MTAAALQVVPEPTDFPKNHRDNLIWRRKILLRAKNDLAYQRKVKNLFHRDILFAFNAFFYTLDVRKRPNHHQPFCTYLFQDESILEIVDRIIIGKDLPIEKSRDMGLSWIMCGIFLWFWLDPEGGADFLIGSRVEDYVDKKGSMRALFPKLRYLFSRLPSWIKPNGFEERTHNTFLKLENPETGSTVVGESNNANYSTGGRFLAILFDEFAKWETTDVSAWTAAGDASPCRIPLSTSNGAAGQFYSLITEAGDDKLRLHWSLHPEKADGLYCVWPREEDDDVELRSPWYDRECSRRTPLEIAQELDIDYIGAGNPVFDGVAGRRVRRLLKRGKSPVAYLEPNLAEGGFNRLDTVRDADGVVSIYKQPSKEDSFIISVDVAEGLITGDFSTIKVLNRETKSIDLSYYSRLDEVQLAKVVYALAEYLPNYPWVAIETNGPGLATFDLVSASGYPFLFMMPIFDQSTQRASVKKGWRTTASSRNKLIAAIREWLIEGEGWADGRCVGELTTFIKNKIGRPEAKAGAHDDEVIALGIGLMVDQLVPQKEAPPKGVRRGSPLVIVGKSWKETATGEKEKTLAERCLDSLIEQRELGNNEEQLRDVDFFENFISP